MAIEVTSRTILIEIKKGNPVSWNRFFTTYRPLIWMMAARYRLSPDEKEELVSAVMTDFFNAQSTFVYDRAKGRFRDYFSRIVRHKIYALFRDRRRRQTREVQEDESLLDIADPAAARLEQEQWDNEWRMHIFRQALEEARKTVDSRKIQVFMMWQFEHMDPKDICRQFNLSLATLYNYRTLVLEALRKAVKELDEGGKI